MTNKKRKMRKNQPKAPVNDLDGADPKITPPVSKDRERQAEAQEAERPIPFTRLNWILAVVGLSALAGGFYLLSLANAQGDNSPALFAPPIILGAYLIIFVAIVLKAPKGRKPSRQKDRS